MTRRRGVSHGRPSSLAVMRPRAGCSRVDIGGSCGGRGDPERVRPGAAWVDRCVGGGLGTTPAGGATRRGGGSAGERPPRRGESVGTESGGCGTAAGSDDGGMVSGMPRISAPHCPHRAPVESPRPPHCPQNDCTLAPICCSTRIVPRLSRSVEDGGHPGRNPHVARPGSQGGDDVCDDAGDNQDPLHGVTEGPERLSQPDADSHDHLNVEGRGGECAGLVGYRSPEQICRERAKDMASDYGRDENMERRFAERRGINFRQRVAALFRNCLLYTSPSPRDGLLSRMPSSA